MQKFFLCALLFYFSCAEPSDDSGSVGAQVAANKFVGPQKFRMPGSGVAPLLDTEWGQSGVWQQSTPLIDGEPTYPGCTTIAGAQILYYYQYQNHASYDICYDLDTVVSGEDVSDGTTLCVDFDSDDIQFDWDAMAINDSASDAALLTTSDFIYHVGVTLNAQFGGGEGSSATARQIENAFRYQWGFEKKREDNARAKSVTIVSKDEFFENDDDFASHLRMELREGRPVMYMAQQVDADTGHAFVIDGYDAVSGLFHVNWGWGGAGNGYYDLTLTDPSGRSWSRNALIYQYLEPVQDYANELQETGIPQYSWNGNGSLISYSSGTNTGYGLTIDEAAIHPSSIENPVVFFQWELDQRDGTRLKIDAQTRDTATITFGVWNDRSSDVTYADVSLPFVLDPALANLSIHDQQYYVVAVRFDARPESSESVIAEVTTEAGTEAEMIRSDQFLVDGGTWNGNGSLIDFSSGSLQGYGLQIDEGYVSSDSLDAPRVFFQWEIDNSSGDKLEISADGQVVDVTYGLWNDRSSDITHEGVSLPYTIDPAADGMSAADGEYYVIKVSFSQAPTGGVAVVAEAKK